MKRKDIKKIYLVWRQSIGKRRIAIGEIDSGKGGIVSFKYIPEGVKIAAKDGFLSYPDFPDITKRYSSGVLEAFSQRLNNSQRSDIQKYYDFWNISEDMKNDKFLLLAQTQGMLSTDNFEFVADYKATVGLSFTSEISGLSHVNLAPETLNSGDMLEWKHENTNEHDRFAVKLFKDGKFVGYVKIIHNRVFYSANGKSVSVQVKNIERNGSIHRAFILIKVY